MDFVINTLQFSPAITFTAYFELSPLFVENSSAIKAKKRENGHCRLIISSMFKKQMHNHVEVMLTIAYHDFINVMNISKLSFVSVGGERVV